MYNTYRVLFCKRYGEYSIHHIIFIVYNVISAINEKSV